MKTKLLLLSLMLISTLSFAQTIIRVKSGEKIQNIIDDIKNPSGMILLLDPGSYEGFTAYKTVSIIGSGYSNGSNSTTIQGSVRFSKNNNTNSDNSVIMGCNVDGIQVNQNNILINRCRVNSVFTAISISDVNNCKISQSFIVGSIGIGGSASNFTIQNNLVQTAINIPFVGGAATGKIINNTVGFILTICDPLSYGYTINGIAISNNIFISPVTCDNRDARLNYPTSSFAKFNNNILRKGNYQSTDVSNKFLTDMTTIFANAGSSDTQYLLSTNSPAKGAGEGGTDCGAFGGSEPYIIGGLPIGPVITDLQVPSTARQNETIQIKLKAKVQN
jgi:hypothetical protein